MMRALSRALAIAVAALLAAASAAAAGQAAAPAAPSNDDCSACHGDPTLTRASGAGVSVDMSTFAASKHGEMACVDCHTDLAKTDYPHAEKLVRVNCASCHGDVGATYDDSIHARARRNAGLNVAPACANCHGTHDILGKADSKSRVSHAQVPATCGTCHEGIRTRYEMGAHAAALKTGKANAPSCATCHTAHAIQRLDAPGVRLAVTAECGTCHLEVVESYVRTFHGKVTQLGSAGVAACSDCHSPHEILPASSPASTVAPNNLLTTCSSCHPGASASFVQYDPHPNPNDYDRSPVLWWANTFYWLLIPACFGFFGLHSALWFWRTKKGARAGGEAA
jgi:nitrate/TMAO reductase-like tetraheme cytochrome c subunit